MMEMGFASLRITSLNTNVKNQNYRYFPNLRLSEILSKHKLQLFSNRVFFHRIEFSNEISMIELEALVTKKQGFEKKISHFY